ncbi:DUF6043 family protein [Phocaeicola vulgatus]|uniref:DUF6043 family protein n=1 Tax=Phocaeicola vulgatus TaxID=821 RepID=UPI001C393BE5|nr:DUF6043 family protein [Phocaeicola vulgatus]MBV3764373.1 hypothetical protein [Phocaeicola vulgatus]MBV3768816.1 hypothetical protein [Phocaeicola vulgatus]MBV3778086.1 hypothetical protein [Phocaeicola vulgatus]MBV3787103.1 hypothetical protein [Phocaeicola vulgatus]MBV3791276.1 hypothetical protein [Phocaeicola vulgatus]
MINFIERIKSYSKRKDAADMVIRAWKSDNKKVYADFCKRMNAVAKGNMSVLMDMYLMMRDCVPPEALMMYNWLSVFVNVKDVSDIANQQWAGQYTETIARCITNKRLWIGINVKTGTVELLASPKSGLLMVHSETPIEMWSHLPQELKSYLSEQLDKLIRNSKGCYLLSKLERKMVYQFLTYISQIVFLSHAVFIGGFMANLYDRVMEKKEDLAYCMYYFVVFDHGLSRMAKLFNRLLNSKEVDIGDMLLVKSCVTLLVNGSIEMGTETKADWEDTIEGCTPEIWKEVMFALRKVKGRRGNRKVIQSLDDILVGDKEHIKQGIRLFLEENTEDITLAYLLKSLVKADRIKASTKYMTFHRAIEQFSQRHYGHDIPQKRYGEIKELTLNSPQRGSSYTKAKRIIDRWTDYFISNE